jgi:L-fuculose-phosphate aldolase
LPEVIVSLGCVPLAEYGLPGTPALTNGMLPYIPKYDAILLGNHGSVCYGEDVYKAFFKMETVEHFARVTLVSELLGGPKILPKHEVGQLFEARGRYGVKSHNRMEPGRPVVAEDKAAEDKAAEDKAAEGVKNAERGRELLHITRDDLIALVDEALRLRGVLT